MTETFHAGPNLGRLSDVTIIHGDCIEAMRELADDSIDAIVCDPPYGLGFMGKEWDALPPGLPWAQECLRVLKPGGHLLAFGGTRTWHRLAVAVEDAGFEIRDSIAWLYGSGFPKSLDVSKAIDKGAGIWRGRAGAVVSENSSMSAANYERTPKGAPATPEAEQWQGWGTALKPAFEPVVVGRKPLMSPAVNVLEMVELGLRDRGIQGDIRWTKEPANGAARLDPQTSSSSTDPQPVAETSAAHVAALETQRHAQPTGNSCETGTQPGATPTESTSTDTAVSVRSTSGKQSSTLTAESAPAAANPTTLSSPSTTSEVEARSTDSRLDDTFTQTSSDADILLASESFAGIATGLTGSLASVRITRKRDGSFIWPNGLPKQVKAKSLNVAANVLAHGTGALNIDATRIATTDRWEATGVKSAAGTAYQGSVDGSLNVSVSSTHAAGRWPANVCLDSSQAAALDEQSGTLTSGSRKAGTYAGLGYMGSESAEFPEVNGNSGGASRFFYCAKAPKKERPIADDGTSHATVKPLTLMRWLVRLVTPPGGVVLDPFAGSGTTVEAALLEGFRVIGIEREADYLPLIQQRIARCLNS